MVQSKASLRRPFSALRAEQDLPMETMGEFGQAMMALSVGEGIGFLSERLTSHIDRKRRQLDFSEEAGLLDKALSLFTQSLVLVLGISFVEKAIPTLTRDLHTLMFFTMGLFHSHGHFQNTITQLTEGLKA